MGMLILSLIGVCCLLLYFILCVPKALYNIISGIYTCLAAFFNFIISTVSFFVGIVGKLFGMTSNNKEADDKIKHNRRYQEDINYRNKVDDKLQIYRYKFDSLRDTYPLADINLFKKYRNAMNNHEFDKLEDIEYEIMESNLVNSANDRSEKLYNFFEAKDLNTIYTEVKNGVNIEVHEAKDDIYVIIASKGNFTRLFQVEFYENVINNIDKIVNLMQDYQGNVTNEWL